MLAFVKFATADSVFYSVARAFVKAAKFNLITTNKLQFIIEAPALLYTLRIYLIIVCCKSMCQAIGLNNI